MNALLAEIALTTLSCALLTFSYQVFAENALELFIYVFDSTHISDTRFLEIITISLST